MVRVKGTLPAETKLDKIFEFFAFASEKAKADDEMKDVKILEELPNGRIIETYIRKSPASLIVSDRYTVVSGCAKKDFPPEGCISMEFHLAI